MFIVNFPTELNGDLRQPTCIPAPGNWVQVNSPTVPYQLGQDTEVDEILASRAEVLDAYSLLDRDEYKYRIVHEQRYEPYGRTFYVAPGDECRPKYTVTVGTEVVASSIIETVTGWKAGLNLTGKVGTQLKLGMESELMAKLGIPGTGSLQTKNTFNAESTFLAELAATIRGDISRTKKVGDSFSKILSQVETTEISYTIYGGNTGKRCVMWQIVDRFQFLRPFDQKLIFEFHMPTHKELLTYPFELQSIFMPN